MSTSPPGRAWAGRRRRRRPLRRHCCHGQIGGRWRSWQRLSAVSRRCGGCWQREADVLDPAEAAAVAEQFGVAAAQVRRDHLISHLLAALSTHLTQEVIFFGGTALARSLVPNGRLSEDIDLLAVRRRRDVVAAVESHLVGGVRREYPGLRWDPPLLAVRDVEPAVLIAPDGLTVRIQLLDPVGHAPWPIEPANLVQRYSDAPPARLLVPTAASFAAWKTSRGPIGQRPETCTTCGRSPDSAPSTPRLPSCSLVTAQPTPARPPSSSDSPDGGALAARPRRPASPRGDRRRRPHSRTSRMARGVHRRRVISGTPLSQRSPWCRSW